MVFFNSLRELGTSLTLLQSDIPDYLRTIQNRENLDFADVRNVDRVREMTGRLTAEQVPKAMEELGITADNKAIDFCLASNIIEVGIDVDRLSLMAVVGQPKTTSQYIQVTGRVGRKWAERPGLIVTILSPAKPRDRSHFERFRSYHERLYAQVEPTSVTPFSPPVLDRALHAVLVGFVRQFEPKGTAPWPTPIATLLMAESLLSRRVAVVDSAEEKTLERVFQRRRDEWDRWERTRWESGDGADEVGLMRRAGKYATRAAQQISWSVPSSMRNVDAECRAEITNAYIRGDSDE